MRGPAQDANEKRGSAGSGSKCKLRGWLCFAFVSCALMDVPLAQALQLDGNHSPAERSRERVRQLLLVYGRTVSGVTGPVEFNKDPIGHPQWVIDPRQSEFELIITVK